MQQSDQKTISGQPALIKNVCVYCGSAGNVAEIYRDAATQLGRILVKNGLSLVYGGGRVGLMGLVADAVLHEGGKAYGIIPHHIAAREVSHTGLTELHVVETMHERKKMMVDRADAFVILPGGLGTMDEFFEIMTWRQLGLQDKPVVVVNIEGYWTPLLRMIDHLIEEWFAREADRQALLV
ncbi:MAG: TIGR00730 family Rossman fold protein, partial [Micavibrio aeruginosavorus]|nr:TIGR00730 family Rossman fold protein [Micavibrio aeruginosavorus]